MSADPRIGDEPAKVLYDFLEEHVNLDYACTGWENRSEHERDKYRHALAAVEATTRPIPTDAQIDAAIEAERQRQKEMLYEPARGSTEWNREIMRAALAAAWRVEQEQTPRVEKLIAESAERHAKGEMGEPDAPELLDERLKRAREQEQTPQ